MRIVPNTSQTKESWTDTLLLKTTMPELRERKIQITGSVEGSVTADPAHWVLGRLILREKHPKEMRCVIRLTSTGQPFTVLQVTTNQVPGLTAVVNRISSTEWQLKLSLSLDAFLKTARSKVIFVKHLEIRTDLPNEGPVKIPVLAAFD